MSIFFELKQQLFAQLANAKPHKGLVELEASVESEEKSSLLLAWLKGQRHFPQMFWQERDADYACATLGEIREYRELKEAVSASRSMNLPLLGGLTFEGECCFRLPRVMIVAGEGRLSVSVFLDTSHFEQERETCQQILSEFDQISPLVALPKERLSESQACDFPRWESNISQALKHIQETQLHKVVLANATTLAFAEPICAYSLLAQSQAQNQGCYHFLLAENAEAFFVGSSPECLYRRENQTLHTEALAGTVAVSQDPTETAQNREWLLSDVKNINENQWVVDDIQQQLQGLNSQFEVDNFSIKQLKNVQHLRRKISVQLNKNVSDVDCLARIHPTAAVSGLPREAAKAFIREQEPFKRGWYAGALGMLAVNSASFCVALRSALVEQNKITVYAGAGIVEGSEAENEWREIERKSHTLLSLFPAEERK